VVIAGGRVADVYTGRWIEADVEIRDGRIVYVGPPRGDDPVTIDARGKLVVPGYIEPHAHPWCLYSPASLLEVAVPDGTTTIVYDNLFFYLAHGVPGLRRIVDAMNTAPAHVKWVARIAAQTAYEDDAFPTEDVAEMLAWPEVLASGEITNWFAVTQEHPELKAGIAAAKALRKRVEGHNAGASFPRLNALSAAGISADHEAITGEEALQRLQLGMWTMLRQSSLRPDLAPMLKALAPVVPASRRLMLTTDGAAPSFYAERGVIGGALRVAVESGVDPMRALQMATIDPATFLGLDEELGGIAPGRRATLNVLPDAAAYRGAALTAGGGAALTAGGGARDNSARLFAPELVLVDGEVVARDGRLTAPLPDIDWPVGPKLTLPTDPAVYASRSNVTARHESAVINRRADGGGIHAALVARDGSWITHGRVDGLMDDVDGFATTLTTSLHVLVLGKDPRAMARAAAKVQAMQGGTAFDQGWAQPLEIDGLIVDGSYADAVAYERELERHARAAGYPFHDVVYSLLFASGDFLPELRLTPRGLLDVKSRTVLEPAQRLR
jgi:adenine deaminase